MSFEELRRQKHTHQNEKRPPIDKPIAKPIDLSIVSIENEYESEPKIPKKKVRIYDPLLDEAEFIHFIQGCKEADYPQLKDVIKRVKNYQRNTLITNSVKIFLLYLKANKMKVE